MTPPLIIAVPKGRILTEAVPLLMRAGISPEASFGDEDSRALRFSTDQPGIDLIRVRAFDVATFGGRGAARAGGGGAGGGAGGGGAGRGAPGGRGGGRPRYRGSGRGPVRRRCERRSARP